MSFEGYYQCICENGHYYTIDVYAEDRCPNCGGKRVFENIVDETNCDSYGLIPFEVMDKFIIKGAESNPCVHCNGTGGSFSPAIFRAPSKEEVEKIRHFYDSEQEKYVKISELED